MVKRTTERTVEKTMRESSDEEQEAAGEKNESDAAQLAEIAEAVSSSSEEEQEAAKSKSDSEADGDEDESSSDEEPIKPQASQGSNPQITQLVKAATHKVPAGK